MKKWMFAGMAIGLTALYPVTMIGLAFLPETLTGLAWVSGKVHPRTFNGVEYRRFIDARYQCEDTARTRIASPRTAMFDRKDYYIVEGDYAGYYVLRDTVTAQTTHRRDAAVYHCTVRAVGDTWEVTTLLMDPPRLY
jgi:hypothetical protein